MKKYKNIITGATLETESKITGENWVLVKENKSGKQEGKEPPKDKGEEEQ